MKQLTESARLVVSVYVLYGCFLGVKWFSVIGTAYKLTGPLFSTYLKGEVGSSR